MVAFRKALESYPDDPKLHYNLAQALWRAGDLDAAETAAEKAATLGGPRLEGLRDGLLGNLRYDQARQMGEEKVDPKEQQGKLEAAIEKAGQARRHLQRGALALETDERGSGAQLMRNLERTIQLQKKLKKQLEDLKKEQKKKDDKKDDKKKDDKKDQKNDKKKSDDKDKDKDKKDDKKPDDKDKKPGKDQPEPKPEDKKDDKKDGESKKQEPKPKPSEKDGEEEKRKPQKPKAPPPAVPGEFDPNKELTPEQKRKLMQRLKAMEELMMKLRADRKAKRPKVKKDW